MRRNVFDAWEQQPELASQILSIIGQLYGRAKPQFSAGFEEK
jgi:hypothetical protein